MNNKGSTVVMILFGVAFVALVAAAYIYSTKDDTRLAQMKKQNELFLGDIKELQKKIGEIQSEKDFLADVTARTDIQKLSKEVEWLKETLNAKMKVADRSPQSLSGKLVLTMEKPLRVEPIEFRPLSVVPVRVVKKKTPLLEKAGVTKRQ